MRKTVSGSGVRLAALTLVALLGWWVPPLAAQTRQTKQVMRQKLAHSQQLLAALVTSNWASLASGSRDLEALTRQPGWDVLRLPEFNKQTLCLPARDPGAGRRFKAARSTHGAHRLQRARGQLRGVPQLRRAVPNRDQEVSD
jgi:hypothetical protein